MCSFIFWLSSTMFLPKKCKTAERWWKNSFDQFNKVQTSELKGTMVKKSNLKKTPIRKIWLKKQKRLKEEWSEVEVFRERWNCWSRKCMFCWKTVYWAFVGDELKKPWCFPHTLSKWMYPQFRLLLENIWLVCNFYCHAEYDKLFVDLAVRREIEERFNLLIQQNNVNSWS